MSTRIEQLCADLAFNQDQYKVIRLDLTAIMGRITVIKQQLAYEEDFSLFDVD